VDLATLTNAPREVTIDGKVYRVSALDLAEWGRLQAWIKDHADPVVQAIKSLNRARADGVPVAEVDRKALMAEARIESRNFPPRVGTLAWLDLIDNTPGGNAKFLGTVLAKHQPEFAEMTEDNARLKKLMEWLDGADGRDSGEKLFSYALGIPDPKIEPPQPGANGTHEPSVTTGAGLSTGS
jgi:hypothetical protein